MAANNNLKRKSLLNDFQSSLKKFKAADDNIVDIDDDCELHIDVDFNISSQRNISQTATRPLNYDSLSVTLSSGHRCYVKTCEDDYQQTNKIALSTTTASAAYYRLLDEIDNSKMMKKSMSTVNNDDFVMSATNRLWVDKYTPKRYSDLLSNEFVNRSLLTWMKLWDKFVFKRDAGLTLSNSDIFGENPFQVNEHDGRPLKLVVLLSGPPGIGKTTLAQILARHCGYKALEMNASNERNPEQFYEKIDIVNSTSGWTNNDNGLTPSCLIIDEIDGTSSAAINVLIGAINSSTKSRGHGAKKGKEKAKLSIRRPVICICNDLYAPSLKNLRPLCYVIRVGAPDYNTMLARITDICQLEGMCCDRHVMNRLIDSSNRDIRSCLNTLQFLNRKGNREVTLKELESVNIGEKDVQKGIFNVWEEIFCSTTLKNMHNTSENRTLKEAGQRCNHILKLTHSAGDLDRVISGIYENYLSIVRFKDVGLKEMVESTQWMVFNDMTNSKIAAHQLYELMKYKQYIVPYFHLTFASATNANKKLVWPTSDTNAHFNQQKMTSIYQTFMSNQKIINSWFHDKQETIKVVLPNLAHIIRPCQLRPINTQLFSGKEKIILHNTVVNMMSTGINYVQERSGELTFQYVLQPNIDELVEFDLSRNANTQLSYATKQMIANEVKAEKIRKHAAPPVEQALIGPSNNTTQNRMSTILQMEKSMTTNATILCPKKKASHFSFAIEKKKCNEANSGENMLCVAINYQLK